MEERTGVYRVLVRKYGGRDQLEHTVAVGRIIFKWIFKKDN